MSAGMIKTYISGLDEHLCGGIPEGSIVLLAGTPGTLKSTVAYNMAYRNAKNDARKSLYILLDKSRRKFMSQLEQYGMDDAGGSVMLYDMETIRNNLSHYKGVNWWEPFKAHLKVLKQTYDFQILIIDSIQMLEAVAKIPDIRSETYNIFHMLESELNVSGLIVSEMSCDSNKYGRYDEEILADGILHLTMTENPTGIERRIRCVKMRGVPHSIDFFRLSIRNNMPFAEKISSNASGSTLPPAARISSQSPNSSTLSLDSLTDSF